MDPYEWTDMDGDRGALEEEGVTGVLTLSVNTGKYAEACVYLDVEQARALRKRLKVWLKEQDA